jgi:hypothetical protein
MKRRQAGQLSAGTGVAAALVLAFVTVLAAGSWLRQWLRKWVWD